MSLLGIYRNAVTRKQEELANFSYIEESKVFLKN